MSPAGRLKTTERSDVELCSLKKNLGNPNNAFFYCFVPGCAVSVCQSCFDAKHHEYLPAGTQSTGTQFNSGSY